ncbi:SurA N-terminal domain-containing protein [Porticoccaceae bacterium]|nr:SurA N-terminal domain-containing protein [Porticoccaceae bacterium]MDA9014402.1 SurA N-terminal domain-containing protein [Porticoccaceae bacterium]
MLLDFRNNMRGVAIGITIVIALIFALTGTGSLFLSTPDSESALVVNGEDISEREVLQAIAREQSRILNSNPEIDRTLIDDVALRPQVLRQLISREVLIQAANDQDLGVAPSLINELILDIEQFQTDGVFDQDRFRYAIRSQGYPSSSKFTEMLADQFLVEQLSNGIVDTSFITSDEVASLTALVDQKRSFEFARLAYQPFVDAVELSDEKIANYYDENQAQYTTERKLSVEYIELNPAMLLDQQSVSDEQVQARFDQEAESADNSPSLRAAHILLEDDSVELIAEVQAKIDAGEDFAELVKEYTQDVATAEMGGDLGFTDGSTFPDAFEEALAALEVGQVSAPVETVSGTHFVKLLEVEKKEFLFEDQQQRIAQELKQEAADTLLVEKLEMLKELAFNADNLQDVAEDLALQAKISEPFGQNGGAGVAASTIVVNAAYSPEVAEDGYASEVLDLGDDNYIVLRLKENFPSRQQSLEEVRVQLTQTLTNAVAQENIDAMAAEITAALDAKDSLSSIATNFELEVEKADAVDRRNQVASAEINTFAFELATPRESAITDSFTAANGDFVVLELSEVQLADKGSLDKERLNLIRSVAETATSSKEFVSYQQALIEQAKIVQ